MHISAPGKLFLSGEWAVLGLGNPGIVAAVNKRVHVEIAEAEEITVTVDDFGIKNVKAVFDSELHLDCGEAEKERLVFMKGAIEATLNYLGKWKPFAIHSWSEETQIGNKKIGFGSSAAAVVATVAALLKFHGMDISKKETKDVIYKLSAIAHYYAQGKVGSAFDVAASTYGGIFVYRRFDADWLVKQVKKGSVKKIVERKWPGFSIEELEIPKNFIFLVGWTKESASSSSMVKQMIEFMKKNPKEYQTIYDNIASLVKELILTWKNSDKEKIIKLINKNEDLLRELGEKSGVDIETPDLRKLAEIAKKAGAAGKLSGAGGGDCGIAICFDRNTAEKIKKEWQKSGLYLIDVSVDRKGVLVE